jgi:heptosyltransferase III
VKPPRIARPRRVLVVQLRRLGDVVLSTALLPDLRRVFPHARVDFLVGAGAAPLLDHHPLIDERLLYDHEHPSRTWRAVRERRYDWIIDPQSSPRTAPLALLSGAPVRSGFNVRGWGWVYTHRLPRAGRPVEYVARERQRLLESLGVIVEAPRTSLALTDAERAEGRRLLHRHDVDLSRPTVAFVLSSAERAREWPPGHFAAVADAGASQGVQSVVFEMPGDESKVAALRAASSAVISIAAPGLRDFMGALAACNVLVSGSTGPAHIATAIGVPRVTIHGPDVPSAWIPANDASVVALWSDSARARGQVRASDPRAMALTAQVQPAEVHDALQRLLGANRARVSPSR